LTRAILKKIENWKNFSVEKQLQIKENIEFKFNDQNPEKIIALPEFCVPQ
jgi:hypothetical protein